MLESQKAKKDSLFTLRMTTKTKKAPDQLRTGAFDFFF